MNEDLELGDVDSDIPLSPEPKPDAGPEASPERMSLEAARQITRDAFRRILKRAPEESVLEAYSHALLTKALTPRDMVLELVESEEFGRNPSNSSMSREDARSMTVEAFRRILNREPEESALEAYTGDLLSGALTPLGLVFELVETEEFANRAKPPAVAMSVDAARAITTEAFQRILKRQPDETALTTYSDSLLAGALGPLDMALDLIESEEFADLQEQSILSMSQENAHAFTAEAFRLILDREADETDLASHSSALVSAALTPIDIIRGLIESEEFGARAQSLPVVARYVARSVITALIEPDPDPDFVADYARALENGYSLEVLLRETTKPDDFAYPDIGQLAEQLIVAHLVSKGGHIPAPPRKKLQERSPISEDRMRAMLHTLAMLAH